MSLETVDNNSSQPNKRAGGRAAAIRIAIHGFKALALNNLSVPPDQNDRKQQLVLCSSLLGGPIYQQMGERCLKTRFSETTRLRQTIAIRNTLQTFLTK